MQKHARLSLWFSRRYADLLLGLLLVAAAVLCHARYLLSPELLFATEGDSFRQILPTSILFQNALASGDPFWSWSFGLGGDMFTELSYAGTTSVFTYLQFLLRTLTTGVSTDLFSALSWKLTMSVIRLALAMLLTFSLLRTERVRPAYAAVGALAYGCAPWFLYRAILFDFMTDAFVLLPFAALAFARYRKTGRWMLLSIAIALLIGANVYFGYISCIFLASIFLLFSFERGMSLSDYARRVGKLVGISVIGALLACALLLPSINGVLSSDRTVGNAQLRFLPRLSALKNAFPTLFMGSGMLALPTVGLLAFFLKPSLVNDETKKRTLLAALWLMLLFIPAASSMMNGFSYETPRWQFVVIFAVATALPYWLDALEWQGGPRVRSVWIWALSALLLALYAVFCEKVVSVASLARAIAFLLSVFCIPWAAFRTRLERTKAFPRLWSAVLVLAICGAGVLNSISVRVHNLYASDAEAMFFGSAAQRAASAALVPQEGAFYRSHDLEIDVHDEDAEARPFVYGTYGISNYASELSGALSRWHKKTFRFRTTPVCAAIYQSFDDRLFPEIAWGLRYKIPAENAARDLPSVWRKTQTATGEAVYENALFTGFSLWYDKTLPEADWLALPVAERDALLLQCAAVDETIAARYPAARPDDVTTVLPAAFADAELSGAYLDGAGLLHVSDQATLSWAVPAQSDEGEWLMALSLDETSGEPLFSLTAGGRTLDKFADVPASESLNYPLSDYALRFAGEETRLTVTLSRGVYRISDFSVSYNSYAHAADWVRARSSSEFDSLCVSGSHVDGVFTAESDGILALSMPFNRGWVCRVDGVKTPLIRVNGVFAGVELTAGTHALELHYTPPYLVLGACVSLLTALSLAAVHFFKKRKSIEA